MVFINTNLCFQSSKVKMNIFFPLFEQRHKTYLLCQLFWSDSDHPNADNSSFPNLYPHCLLKPFFSFFCLLLSILYSFSNFSYFTHLSSFPFQKQNHVHTFFMSLIFCLTETAGHQITNTGTTEQTRSIPTCQALLKALNIHRCAVNHRTIFPPCCENNWE